MHDCKGRLIELGDHLRFSAYTPGGMQKTLGRVATVYPGNKTCNLMVVYLVPGYWPLQQATITAAETELILKADGDAPADA